MFNIEAFLLKLKENYTGKIIYKDVDQINIYLKKSLTDYTLEDISKDHQNATKYR